MTAHHLKMKNTETSRESATFSLKDSDFKVLARILYEESGISMQPGKSGLMVSRLSRRLKAVGLSDFGSYARFVSQPQERDERAALVSALTTNVTAFFREKHHFDAMSRSVLPPLIAAARSGGRLRIWSAGCSSGEEPYSLAMTILELCPDALRHDIRILATDIDPVMITTARFGQYKGAALAGVPAGLRQKYVSTIIDQTGSGAINPEVMSLVHFDELNLHGKWPMKGSFDIVFCRNVVIYFDPPTRAMLWQRFAAIVAPGGHLFIGHSERVDRVCEPYFESNGLTQYRRTALPPSAQTMRDMSISTSAAEPDQT